MSDLKEQLYNIFKEKSLIKGDCEIIPYKRGKETKLIFKINGEIRNIELFFSPAELKQIMEIVEAI